jgi:hypothetical protein
LHEEIRLQCMQITLTAMAAVHIGKFLLFSVRSAIGNRRVLLSDIIVSSECIIYTPQPTVKLLCYTIPVYLSAE